MIECKYFIYEQFKAKNKLLPLNIKNSFREENNYRERKHKNFFSAKYQNE